MRIDSLPHLDEHTTLVAATPDEVWPHLADVVEATFSRPGMTGYARLVGAADPVTSGPRPLTEGSTFPGFHVATAIPGQELALRGSHRFSTYALIFRLDAEGPARSRLRAETRAVFPGLAGGLYRHLLLRSGGHVLGVRRMLTAVRRRSEQAPPSDATSS
ncbi:hypothetical protein EV382_2087 [Micromonospora violae]|uniref:Polyketide cyclase/dehydrase/lipid transport protein n=1 Tax=Micromonospora violae TaxID=1278207 RepID=A0A4Q7UDU3_9ACTN|nr:hypothetical protein [Micromonospora violae]RZT78894.1 hypothetical protein EV382_2087 [Micromonospora violae]